MYKRQLLYYTYLSPQQLANTQEIIEKLEPHIRDISYRTYFRKRQMASGRGLFGLCHAAF